MQRGTAALLRCARLIRELQPRTSSLETTRCYTGAAMQAQTSALEGYGEMTELKRMNLFTAVNDALHIALDTDPK